MDVICAWFQQGIPAPADDGAPPPPAGEQAQGGPANVEEHILVDGATLDGCRPINIGFA